MNTYNKIVIDMGGNDLVINDGVTHIVGKASYRVNNNTLYIEAFDDLVISIPGNHYQEINIKHVDDCVLNCMDSKVDVLLFDHCKGDVVINCECDEVSYGKRVKPVKTVKEESKTPIYRDGERYR